MESNYWTRMRSRRISRRTMLTASARAGVGAAGLALVGCGDDDDDAQQQTPAAAAATAQQQEQQSTPPPPTRSSKTNSSRPPLAQPTMWSATARATRSRRAASSSVPPLRS